ncbi:uncharacterized protein AC631_04220 [Debaryomyces fabryi]|uniref:F-box domain-containing protein n=1 Tax=Debaryomyces fabryi TaxID=58627 RepID=A0A0V1PV19_9ASCO|nr:uncharacterized protein AC631_04220 [Debaryomyces fabryi]KSA00032.1 hypothetical protein AC631_04220 [Debaryomyces fabryi]CUM49325.1 unnamed protein product [Debaryomyces fabryi]
MKNNSENVPIWNSRRSGGRTLGCLFDLPNELLTNIFEFMVQEDLTKILSILNEVPNRNDRIFQIVNDIFYSSIIITNYSKDHFHELDELKSIIPAYKVDRSLFWPLEFILYNEIVPHLAYVKRSKRVYYVFGNRNPVESIHKVMRQLCKYLSEVPNEMKEITSEINLLLNVSPSFDTVEEFKQNFQDLNITFLNRVIRHSTVFSDLRRLNIVDGIYYPLPNQSLDLGNIRFLDSIQELCLNHLNLLSVENLQLPSSILILNLSDNKIVNLDGLKLPYMLRKLDLSHNNITFIRRGFFPNALDELNLGSNRLNLLAGHIFPNSICSLDLSNNFIRDVNFIIPRDLKYLSLRHCPIKNICVDARTTIANNNIKIDLW